MNHSLLAAEFITIDNEVPIEHLDDDEILATMQEKEGDDEKAAEPQPNISLKLITDAKAVETNNLTQARTEAAKAVKQQ
ncbi:3734_t:CDS:2 [Paraglomus brasilianum]|uniref:3734_t:CDS:1 n=1 Tax=Paraglomus brasilianum TaxID=144538 RepID=A0A9N9H9B3_9GLOM|nr:3734_t:CDS:2 [Paraglomus brasilianum]